MEAKQREREGIVTRAGGGTGRSCGVMFDIGVWYLSITHLLGTNTTREHLHSLLQQQRNLKICSHPSHSSKGPELPVLKAVPIMTCTFKSPVTKAIWVYHYLHGRGHSSQGQGTGLPQCQPQHELCLAFLHSQLLGMVIDGNELYSPLITGLFFG